MRSVRFGIIGCGLMGREFASAAARWCHLPVMDIRPEIVAVCDTNPALTEWFSANIPSVAQATDDYHVLLANPEVEAVYIALPHHLHAECYCAAIRAGKHLLGEKPFGIDLAANREIMACIAERPEVFVRCSSESPFFPAMQRIGRLLEAGSFGEIIEVNSGFLHSSDLDPAKPINWKRMVRFNGEYGAMGDLGMHACHMPFRAGWRPRDVRAILSNLITERPDGQGGMAACETWDNATLLCTASAADGQEFPWTVKTQRIAPGNTNTWYLEIFGMRMSACWSSRQVNTLHLLDYRGGEQAWQVIDMGHDMAYQSLTGGIFEAGFSDVILQMWAAFLYELAHGVPLRPFAGCVTPAEAAWSHELFTAALASHRTQSVVRVASPAGGG